MFPSQKILPDECCNNCEHELGEWNRSPSSQVQYAGCVQVRPASEENEAQRPPNTAGFRSFDSRNTISNRPPSTSVIVGSIMPRVDNSGFASIALESSHSSFPPVAQRPRYTAACVYVKQPAGLWNFPLAPSDAI